MMNKSELIDAMAPDAGITKAAETAAPLSLVGSAGTSLKGGGRVFGPTPRDYSQKVNKKVKRLARKSALSIKAKQNSIIVLEDIQWDAPKTKNYLQMLAALGLSDKKSLLVLGDLNKNVYLSSRNLKNSKVVINSELNTYGISNANSLILSESSIAGLESILNK